MSAFQTRNEICHYNLAVFQLFAKFFAVRVRDFTFDVR